MLQKLKFIVYKLPFMASKSNFSGVLPLSFTFLRQFGWHNRPCDIVPGYIDGSLNCGLHIPRCKLYGLFPYKRDKRRCINKHHTLSVWVVPCRISPRCISPPPPKKKTPFWELHIATPYENIHFGRCFIGSDITQRIHVWYIFPHLPQKSTIHIGKYTIYT